MHTDGTSSIPSGRRFELEVFGETTPLTEREAMQVPQLSFAESLANVEAKAVEKLRQGKWDPRSPPTIAALDLRRAVQNALRLTPMLPVEFVNALGTPIDIHWGVDGYFKLAHTDIIVTIDVTTNLAKVRSGQAKADFLLTPPDVSSPQTLDAFAHKVAHLLRKRYKQWEHEAK